MGCSVVFWVGFAFSSRVLFLRFCRFFEFVLDFLVFGVVFLRFFRVFYGFPEFSKVFLSFFRVF